VPTVVFKFGGTSVNSAEKRERIVELTRREIERGAGVVIVVSAMGRRGEPYATDTLLSLLDRNADKNVSDLLIGCGEIISACVVADCFKARGIKAFPMTALQAGISTDGRFADARITSIDTSMMRAKLDEGFVVVLTGFQGYSKTNELTTLGRGGSDTTAVAVGGALKASRVVIYSDVPGVAQADPRIVPQARFLKTIDFPSMLFLSAMGAKVLHPNAIRTAVQFQMPFEAKDIGSDEGGTRIGFDGEAVGGLYGMSILKGAKVYETAGDGPDPAELFDEGGNAVLLTDLDGKRKPLTEYPGCHTLAVCCCGLNPLAIGGILEEKGFRCEASFAKDGKAAFILPEDAAEDAMKAVFAELEARFMSE